MRSKWLWPVLLLVLVAAGALLSWPIAQPPVEPLATQAKPTMTPAEPATATPAAADEALPVRRVAATGSASAPAEAPAPRAPADPAAIPANDDWSSAAIESLLALSDAGSVTAASMLLRRYQRCAAWENAWRRAAELEQSLARSSDVREREQLAAQMLRHSERLQSDSHCEVLPPWTPTTLFDLQWRAAELGDRQATLEVVVNPALSQVPALRHGDRLQRYREQALGLLLGLLQRGDLDVVRLLAETHANPAGQRWLGQLIEADTGLALLYGQLYLAAGGRRYSDRMTAEIEAWAAQLPPAEAATLLARADALAQRYFGPDVARQEMGYGADLRPERGGWFNGVPIGGG